MIFCEIEQDGYFYQFEYNLNSTNWIFREVFPDYGDWSMQRVFGYLHDFLQFIKHHCGDSVLSEVRDTDLLRKKV